MAAKTNIVSDNEFTEMLKDAELFSGLSEKQISTLLRCSGAEIVTYEKGERIFSEEDAPRKLPVLIGGSVIIGRDFYDGRRVVAANYEKQGDVFGYEFLFAEDSYRYGVYAEVMSRARLLMIPKDFLVGTCKRSCGFHSTLISNMMLIMARKTIEMNVRIEVITCGTLRQKIAKLLVLSLGDEAEKIMTMTRQEMADFLNAARPSLSRELMRMQSEGLIDISGRKIIIRNQSALEDIIK